MMSKVYYFLLILYAEQKRIKQELNKTEYEIKLLGIRYSDPIRTKLTLNLISEPTGKKGAAKK